jgi:hypothetical protein
MGYFDEIVAEYRKELERREQNFKYLNDPKLWAWDKLGLELWYKQEEVALSIVHCKDTAVRAGHGVGKSFLAALLACWWIDVHPIGRAFVGTTAPSADQVSGIIFREIKALHILSKKRARELEDPSLALPGNVTEENKWKIDIDGQSITVAQGRKPPDNKSEDAFQGFHAEYVLAIGDEACGLTESMIDGLSNITSNKTSRRLLIGNPTDPRSHFAKIFKELGGGDVGAWKLIGISVFDNPNFHGGGTCKCHPNDKLGLGHNESMLRALSDQSFVDGKKKEYGEESARYISRVTGEFAFEAGSQLFSDYDLAQAKNCHVMPDPENPYRVFGVDVARSGKDATVVYMAERGFVMSTNDETGEETGGLVLDEEGKPIPGIKLTFIKAWRQVPFTDRTEEDGTKTIGQATLLNELARSYAVSEVRIDASGLGAGLIDPLFTLAKNGYLIIEVLGNDPSPDLRAYRNNRAFQYSELRREAFQGTLDIDPKDEQLLDELGGIEYFFATGQGGMQIESKESMKKRGVKSPDYADAAWYAAHDLSALVNSPWSGMKAGQLVVADMEDFVESGMSGWHDYSW